jgi:hypothetical protein
MSFLVLNVLDRGRNAVAWAVFHINQHVVDRFRNIVLAQVANGVRFQAGGATQRQVRRARQPDWRVGPIPEIGI